MSRYIMVSAKIFVELGVKPNYITIFSLLFAFLSFLSIYLYHNIILYVLFILLSGLMDILDGAVARLSGKVSKTGAFLDSTLDRISDALIIFPLFYLGFPVEWVVYLIVVSLLISYTRARGESLGFKMEGIGLIERAERILFIILIIISYMFNIMVSQIIFYLLMILSTITLIQRILYIIRKIE